MKPPTSEADFRLLACDYAEHVLHIFEEKYPDDARVRMCIEMVRTSVLDPKLTDEERQAYRVAARAATAAASAAAYDAAAASAASYAASAASYAASYAATTAAHAASYAANAAYWAARANGQDGKAASEAERAWQRKKADEYSEPEVLL